ncbi:CDP-alcohol phosphatidyltransferase family protein [Actinorhabdospora filicis]|uniref:CDP-alcohol phosphatidyltransferase family protein n=1 Tax=Actinorhabdospora filicis TaxID=1785913 RepID=UPI003D7F5A37
MRRGGTLARRLVLQPLPPIRLRRRGDEVTVEIPAETVAELDGLTAAAEDAEDAPPAPIRLLPGEVTMSRRVKFALVNGCTVTSIAFGMTAMLLASQGQDMVKWAALCLLGSVLMDALDGPLARKFGVASPFGLQMDSLADMCSFGIATPIVVYQWLHGDAPVALVAAACGLVAVCAAIRLARFNVSPKDGRFFSGVPTTMSAAVLVIATVLIPRPDEAVVPTIVLAGVVGALALLMVSSFPYVKLNQLRKLPTVLWILPALGALLDLQATFVIVVALYLVSGPLLWVKHRRRAGSAA